MLHSLLAWTMGLGSLGLFASGFFLPEIRRKNDLIWSGIGLFYALVMAVDSGWLRGGMVIEELASVILIVWFVLQILYHRRLSTSPEKLTPLPNSMETWKTFLKEGWGRMQQSFSDPDALEALFKTEEEDSLLDINKLSAAVTGLFNKGESERPAPATTPSPPSSDSSTEGDDWEEEEATSSETASATPADTTTTTVAETADTPETEVTTEAPAAETQPISEESPNETDASSEVSEATDIEMSDHPEDEASIEQGDESESAVEQTNETAEASKEENDHPSESWPPNDPPT
jgi:hypothetical protein